MKFTAYEPRNHQKHLRHRRPARDRLPCARQYPTQIFHEEEYEPLTELLRKEGYERLEEEILYLFFLGVWQNDLRHGRAVARAIEQERMDVYELWKRCDRDVSFRREFIRHLATYLEPLTVELPNL